MENESYWIAVLPIRTKTAYMIFKEQVSMLSCILNSNQEALKDELIMYEMPPIHNLSSTLTTSYKFFYQANEKPGYTRMSSIISNAQTLKILQRGLEYTIYCGDNGLTSYQRLCLNY